MINVCAFASKVNRKVNNKRHRMKIVDDVTSEKSGNLDLPVGEFDINPVSQ